MGDGVRVPAPVGNTSVRVRLDVAYDGTGLRGWAAQPGLRTVEGELTSAISTLMRHPVVLTVAGRTDAGVHARHQVAHVDVDAAAWAALGTPRGGTRVGRGAHEGGADRGEGTPRPVDEVFVARVNGLLARSASLAGVGGQRGSSDVVVTGAQVVIQDFDARFSASGRHYCYRISDSLASRNPLRRADVWWLDRGVLDLPAMQEAAGTLLGEHDFLSYCKPREGATTIRTLRELEVRRVDLVEVQVVADAFCHSMVRSLVGALVEVGLRRRGSTWPGELLLARSRETAAPLAPACGLTLEAVDYPPEAQWAERARLTRRRRDGGCCGDTDRG